MITLHAWIHLITVSALAMVLKEYLTLRSIVHEEHRMKLWHSGKEGVFGIIYHNTIMYENDLITCNLGHFFTSLQMNYMYLIY